MFPKATLAVNATVLQAAIVSAVGNEQSLVDPFWAIATGQLSAAIVQHN